MGYPSCHDFFLSGEDHRAQFLQLCQWKRDLWPISRIVICGFSSVSFFTKSSFSFLTKLDDRDGNHLQNWLFQFWIPQSIFKQCSAKHSWLLIQVSNQRGLPFDSLPVSPSWTQRYEITRLWDLFLSGTVDDIIFLITSKQPHGWWCQHNFVHGNRVRFKASPDTSLNHVVYTDYKWQGCRHHTVKIPRTCRHKSKDAIRQSIALRTEV